jgi:hypothetical protein
VRKQLLNPAIELGLIRTYLRKISDYCLAHLTVPDQSEVTGVRERRKGATKKTWI